jgi:plastocyanin
MSILGRKVSARAVLAVALVMVMARLLPVMTSAPAREITVVTRGMAFYVDGDFTHPNPTIAVKAGEHLRVVLRNDERGMTHDFAVPAVGAATNLLAWNQQDDVTFTAPAKAGVYEYVCNPHLLMMKGTLIVR